MIRPATLEDLEHVNELWLEYLQELEQQGGPIVPDRRTLEFFTGLAEHYIARDLEGIVLLALSPDHRGVEGVLMWGAPSPEGYPFTLKWGKTAQGWGTYVRPAFRREGNSRDLREAGSRILLGMGFRSVLGSVIRHNMSGWHSGVGFGFEPYEITGVLELGR